MGYIDEFNKKIKNFKPATQHQSQASTRVIELADQIKAWHETRPIPDRWYPVQLGRAAAQFGVSRELAATALQYANWKEKRTGATSLWQPKN
jgi:hypothetical protein